MFRKKRKKKNKAKKAMMSQRQMTMICDSLLTKKRLSVCVVE